MAVVFLKQNNGQKKLIFIFFLLLLITAIVLWFGYFKKDKLEGTGLIFTSFSIKKVNVNFEVFKNPLFGEFRSFSPIEPFKESTSTMMGRENPFISY